jgi:hypothetical protein
MGSAHDEAGMNVSGGLLAARRISPPNRAQGMDGQPDTSSA